MTLRQKIEWEIERLKELDDKNNIIFNEIAELEWVLHVGKSEMDRYEYDKWDKIIQKFEKEKTGMKSRNEIEKELLRLKVKMRNSQNRKEFNKYHIRIIQIKWILESLTEFEKELYATEAL